MDNGIIIKPLSNKYCEQIIDLILPIQQIEFKVPVTREQQSDLLDIETYYLGTGGGFWGAFEEDLLVGTIALISMDNRGGAIRKMFVRKEFRGRELRIAQRLFSVLTEYCVGNRIDDLYLGTVDVLKAAHRFYERNGFQRIGKEDLPASFPLMAVDTIFYHLHLTN